MTREEASTVLKNSASTLKDGIKFLKEPHQNQFKEAYEMAIKALEHELSDDLISRQAVIDALNKTSGIRGDALKALYDIPSAKPQTGYWEMPVQDDGMSDPIYYQVRCSKCGFDLDPQTWHVELHQYGADKYCPKCGVRMEVEQNG